MQARMPNPAFAVANAGPALLNLGKALAAARTGNLPPSLAYLVHIRASQMNGCDFCIAYHGIESRKGGEGEERLDALAAWRDSDLFTPAERAALALTEAVTCVTGPEMVSDALWAETVQHFNPDEMAALLLEIATTNLWNRLNAATRQVFTPQSIAA